jgi:hypothetical protein
MAIEDIKELRTVNGVTQAQEMLNNGWSILAVCVMQDGSSQYAEYHLGKPKIAAEKSNPLRDQFIAAGAFATPKKD